jgi:ankyrin repeat protein
LSLIKSNLASMTKSSDKVVYEQLRKASKMAKNDAVNNLFTAIIANDIDRVHKMESGGVSLRDHENRTCLHVAAVKGYVQIIEYLVSCGAEVNVTDLSGTYNTCFLFFFVPVVIIYLYYIGKTPLMDAVLQGNVPAIDCLVAHGGDIGLSDPELFGLINKYIHNNKLKELKNILRAGKQSYFFVSMSQNMHLLYFFS